MNILSLMIILVDNDDYYDACDDDDGDDNDYGSIEPNDDKYQDFIPRTGRVYNSVRY